MADRKLKQHYCALPRPWGRLANSTWRCPVCAKRYLLARIFKDGRPTIGAQWEPFD